MSMLVYMETASAVNREILPVRCRRQISSLSDAEFFR